MSARIITIFGASGQQGGGVLNAIQNHPVLSKTYQIRAVTRNPSKVGLSSSVEWVKADLNDLDSVKAVVTNSDAVFASTNFWESLSAETEIQQGKNVADAAKEMGVRHLIWSSLPPIRELSQGKISHAVHFDTKAAVERYIESIKGDSFISTHVMPGVFMQNFDRYIKGQDEQSLNIAYPWDEDTTRVPLVDATTDVGVYVAAILSVGMETPAAINGKHFQAVSEWLSPKEMVESMSRTSGKQYRYIEIPLEKFKSFLPPSVADELADTVRLVREYEYYGYGGESNQEQNDILLQVKDSQKVTWERYVLTNR